MFEAINKLYEALGPWPVLQFGAFILMVAAGYKAIQRGEKDKKPSNGNGHPSWTMYGPAHDAMGAVHEIAEQSRRQVDLLERIDHGIQASKTTLELIRNESRLR